MSLKAGVTGMTSEAQLKEDIELLLKRQYRKLWQELYLGLSVEIKL